MRIHRHQRAVQEPARCHNANVARQLVVVATPVQVSMRMFSLFFWIVIQVLNFFFKFFLLSNSKLLHAKARRSHQQQPLPHAKKTSLLLQYAHVVVAQPQLVKLALPRVPTKELHNGQRADPMSLKPKNKVVNVPTIFVSMARNAPKPAISKAFVSVLQVMMLFAWKKSHLPTNVQRHATVTLRWVRLLMYLVNAPSLD